MQPPPITSLAYASDDMIYLAGGDHQVRRWNLANDRLSLAFTAHPSVVQGLAISADGEVIATTDGAATTRVWNARGELQHALTSPGLKPSALAIDRTGQRLLTGAHSAEPTPAACRLQWWDPQRPQPLRTIADFASEDTIVDLSSSPDTWQVATATAGGKFSVWNLKTGLLLQTLKPRSFGSPPRVPLGLDASPDGRHIAVAHDDGFVRVLDRNATQLQREIKVFPEAAACVDFAPNGNLLAVSGYDHNVKLVDPTAGKVVATLSGHQAWVLSTSFSPTGSRLATGSYDKTVRIWDVEQRKMLFQLGQHAASVECVAYAPNGRLLASASSDHVLRLWDTQDRVLLWSNADHLGAIRSIAFAPDGKTLASGSDDKTIRIWNVDGANTQLRHRMVGHRDTVWCVRFSPAGKRLVSGGADGLIGVWDVTKGQAQMLQRRHTDTVSAVLFGPHGSFFLSGGYDKQLLIWPKRGLPARP
ncbi:MAG TPA: hypothetical protein DCY79_09660 [Planctomycetaceae bacterium]|nr:hypothetical protein [Planctomycetaceae bacterium]